MLKISLLKFKSGPIFFGNNNTTLAVISVKRGSQIHSRQYLNEGSLKCSSAKFGKYEGH